MADTLVRLAGAHAAAGRPANAEPLLRRAHAIQRRALRPDHPSLVPTLTTLGQVLMAQGRVADARSLVEAARIARGRLPEPYSQRVGAERILREMR